MRREFLEYVCHPPDAFESRIFIQAFNRCPGAVILKVVTSTDESFDYEFVRYCSIWLTPEIAIEIANRAVAVSKDCTRNSMVTKRGYFPGDPTSYADLCIRRSDEYPEYMMLLLDKPHVVDKFTVCALLTSVEIELVAARLILAANSALSWQ